MDKTVFKLLIILFDLLICYLFKNLFEASSELMLVIKSVVYCNLSLFTFIFWCWGLGKVWCMVNKFLDRTYIDIEKSFKKYDVIERIRSDIQKAIEDEDYEKASVLKKRLDRKLKG